MAWHFMKIDRQAGYSREMSTIIFSETWTTTAENYILVIFQRKYGLIFQVNQQMTPMKY